MSNTAIIVLLIFIIVSILLVFLYLKREQDKAKQAALNEDGGGLDLKSALSLFGVWGNVAGTVGSKAGII